MNADNDNRFPFFLLGRVIGTTTGWDQVADLEITLYDFEPEKGIDLPSGLVSFNFEEGLAKVYSDDGEVLQSYDLVKVLTDVKQAI